MGAPDSVMDNRKLKYSSEPEYERIYKTILQEVGIGGRYLYAESSDSFFTSLFGSNSPSIPCIGVCAGTGSTLQMNLIYRDFTISNGTEVVINRMLRPCDHNGVYHGNADDYMYFPDQKGNIIRVSRRDAPDHILYIARATGLDHIVSAYHLPTERYGFLSDYVGNGALMPIRIDCPDDKSAKIIEIVKKVNS